jgi:DNA-directed RNA polymerase specialized sigma24 family protein
MHTSKHNPNGGATPHCDNGKLEKLIADYQAGTNPTAALAEIVELTQRRALTLIRFHQTTRYAPEDELLSDINVKLLRSISRFDPGRGSAFTYVSRVAQSVLWTAVTNARKNVARHVELDESLAGKLVAPTNSQSQESVDDLADRIRRGVRTTLTNPAEIGMQRWFVDSFIDGAFELRRYVCANAAMRVYNLGHARSRELHDLTLLEIRRVLYDDLKRREPIPAGRLLGRREAWMLRFAPLMTANEFSKFFVLMLGLGPFCILLSDPSNHSRRQDRCGQISRKNIEYVLNGHPDATHLFPQ